MISAPGLGSGLDVNSIVDQLLQSERLPIIQLEAKKSENSIKISAYGQLSTDLSNIKGSLNTLASTDSFNSFKATSSDTDVFTATAASGASAGSYDINITNLAVAHRLNSQAFTDEDTEVGTGTLTITVGTDSFDVTINSENDTVAQIRDAINAATDNTGVKASIVTADDGARLIFTSDNTGTSNKLQVVISGDGDSNDTDDAGLSRLLYEDGGLNNRLVQLDAAEDAALTIDGFAITSSSNAISSAITGVTINLKSEASGTLDVAADYSVISSVLSSFVTRYNDLNTNISAMRSGVLSRDSFLISLESQLGNVFSNQFSGLGADLTSVFDIGLSFDKEGTLSFDSTKLTAALNEDPSAVQTLFTDSSNGFASSMTTIVDRYLGDTGILQGKTDAVNSNNEFIDDRISTLSDRLVRTEQRLLNQFTALDTLMAQLNTTSEFLTQQLAALNFSGQNNN